MLLKEKDLGLLTVIDIGTTACNYRTKNHFSRETATYEVKILLLLYLPKYKTLCLSSLAFKTTLSDNSQASDLNCS